MPDRQLLRFTLADTAFGPLLLAADDTGLVAARFGDEGPLLAELRGEFPGWALERDDAALARAARALEEHLSGARQGLDLALNPRGTIFQQRVWEALRAIPYGETRTYGQLTASAGAPASAIRAVARACASNPLAVLIPCHRVLGAGGALTGYRWGMERKRRLLELEAAARPLLGGLAGAS